jgi:hypothetical protein
MSADATSTPSGQPDDDNHQATAEHPMSTSPEPDFLDAARAEAAQITDADIEARLNRSLRRAGYSTPAPAPVPASTPQPAGCTDEAARADLARLLDPGLRPATAPLLAAPWQQWDPAQAGTRAARRHARQITTDARAQADQTLTQAQAQAAELLDAAQHARTEAVSALAQAAQLLGSARRDRDQASQARTEATELLDAARRERDQAVSDAHAQARGNSARREILDAREAVLMPGSSYSDRQVRLWDLVARVRDLAGHDPDGSARADELPDATCAAISLGRLPEPPGMEDDGVLFQYKRGRATLEPAADLAALGSWAIAKRVLPGRVRFLVVLRESTTDWATAWQRFEPGQPWSPRTRADITQALVAVYEAGDTARWDLQRPAPEALLALARPGATARWLPGGPYDEWLLDAASLRGLHDLTRGLALPAAYSGPASIAILNSFAAADQELSGEPGALGPGTPETAPEGSTVQGGQPGQCRLAELAATALSTGNGELAATVLQALENLAAARPGSR